MLLMLANHFVNETSSRHRKSVTLDKRKFCFMNYFDQWPLKTLLKHLNKKSIKISKINFDLINIWKILSYES